MTVIKMATQYEPEYLYKRRIYLGDIVFEKDSETSSATIFGYEERPSGNGLQQISYACDFSIISTLLLFARKAGVPLIDEIEAQVCSTCNENLIIIDVEYIHGQPLLIEDILLKIYRPMERDNRAGSFVNAAEDNVYIVDSVQSYNRSKK